MKLKPTKTQIASRRNGGLSQGPVTARGKTNSAINRTSHGLFAKCIVLKGECPKTFAQLLNHHIAKYQPQDLLELSAIEEMAAAYWRLRRIWSIETNLMNQTAETRCEDTLAGRIAGSFSQLSEKNDLRFVDRFESRLHRMYIRSYKHFRTIRSIERNLRFEPGSDLNSTESKG